MACLRGSLTVLLLGCVVLGTNSLPRDMGRKSRADDPNPLEAIVMQQGQIISQLQANLDAVKAELHSELAGIKSRLSQQETKVAFSARVLNNLHVLNDQVIVFDTVELNVGGGYSNLTGIFTAPLSGLYEFSLKITHIVPGHLHAGVVKEGHQLNEVDASGDEVDRSTATVAVLLQAGERVWVERFDGTSSGVQHGYRTTLTGVLITPDQP